MTTALKISPPLGLTLDVVESRSSAEAAYVTDLADGGCTIMSPPACCCCGGIDSSDLTEAGA